eukprot:FR736744.1.p1 GENE.FR736744.1~~FR736744.1.p1  ORF type:complete len:214 (+),score=10.41 FR736744.1:37-642(+)
MERLLGYAAMAEQAIHMKEQQAAPPAFGCPDLRRAECEDFNKIIPDIRKTIPTSWSDDDILRLIYAQHEFVNDPNGKPMSRVKWGSKSRKAIQVQLERLRSSGTMFLQRYFCENPCEWTSDDMKELNHACQFGPPEFMSPRHKRAAVSAGGCGHAHDIISLVEAAGATTAVFYHLVWSGETVCRTYRIRNKRDGNRVCEER